MTHKSQSARLAAQRSAAEPKEEGIRRLECGSGKLADQNLALLALILGNGIEQVAAQVFEIDIVGKSSEA